jgi:hypothetical protein
MLYTAFATAVSDSLEENLMYFPIWLHINFSHLKGRAFKSEVWNHFGLSEAKQPIFVKYVFFRQHLQGNDCSFKMKTPMLSLINHIQID